jgi:hypothetical protein
MNHIHLRKAIPRPPLSQVPADFIAFAEFSEPHLCRTQLLPTQVTHKKVLDSISLLGKTTGGATFVIPILRVALTSLKQSHRYLIRRILVIGDGEFHDKPDELVSICRELKENYISLDTIYVGNDGGDSGLKALSGCTIGGKHFVAATYDALAKAVANSPPRAHRRQGVTWILLDASNSMNAELPNDATTTRLAAAIKAIQNVVVTKRVAHA